MFYATSASLVAALCVAPSLALTLNPQAPNQWTQQHQKQRQWKGHKHLPPMHSHATMGNATFEQYIDHSDPGLGTFSQLYYWSSEFWAGPGSPVVLFTPGEVNASDYTGYLTNATTTGVVAQEIGAAVIVIEHRYWGDSSPYAELTTKNMQYLTLNNSISDFNNFARNVQLPFDQARSSTPEKTPWVMMGGSYSGALSAWTASTQPGTFWAYHASSAPVEAISGKHGAMFLIYTNLT